MLLSCVRRRLLANKMIRSSQKFQMPCLSSIQTKLSQILPSRWSSKDIGTRKWMEPPDAAALLRDGEWTSNIKVQVTEWLYQVGTKADQIDIAKKLFFTF